MSYLPFERCLDKPGSIGMAIPGGSFRLIDEAGQVVSGADEVGERRAPRISQGLVDFRRVERIVDRTSNEHERHQASEKLKPSARK